MIEHDITTIITCDYCKATEFRDESYDIHLEDAADKGIENAELEGWKITAANNVTCPNCPPKAQAIA